MSIVFITGASSGFGKACAEKFATAGYDLIITARRTEKLEELQNTLINKYGIKVKTLVFDVRKKEQVEEAINSMSEEWQSADILINNAGLAAGRDFFQDGNTDDWERMLDTNVKGILYVSRCVVKKMIERKKGHIINVSSLAGREVYPQGNVYCASKHAVTALSKGMRQDLLPYNIRVTNISPGLAETEFSIVRFHGDEEKAKKVYEGFTPLHADDVADVIFFAATRPAHVNLEEITILPTAQSDSRTVLKK